MALRTARLAELLAPVLAIQTSADSLVEHRTRLVAPGKV
jgi:hypothetical protein